MIYADLHCHSNYSDGLDSLETVIEKISNAGIKVLAITDHDTMFHLEQAKEIAFRHGIKLIPSVEVSCYDFNVKKKIHVIGLNISQKRERLEMLCQNTLQCRDNYHREFIKQLNEKDYLITYEDCKVFSPYNIVFKMNIFQAILEKYQDQIDPRTFYMEHFHVKNSQEADLHMGYVEIKEAIEAILEAGGIPVLAHPSEYDNFDEIDEYVGYGLKGIEVSHPSMKQADIERTQALIQKHGLIESGGTDYHGNFKGIETPLGQYGLSQEKWEELVGVHNELK